MAKLATIKTSENDASVIDFINAVPDEKKRADSMVILEMMKKATKQEPKMWGSSIIGFGNTIYKSPSTDRAVEWFKIGFSPRKANLTIYFPLDLRSHDESLKKLGKHKLGGGCLYVNKLSDIDIKVLQEMINTTAKK